MKRRFHVCKGYSSRYQDVKAGTDFKSKGYGFVLTTTAHVQPEVAFNRSAI
ncbi:MAG TPA: hypothetical protein VNM72_13395 [Blastocatellia bacterium]|nr:hypothetical protein [Blastocatellia bacterium]